MGAQGTAGTPSDLPRMEPFVPIAFDQEGVQVTPTCSKEQGPFTCVECNDKLILKQGTQKIWHFAHAKVNPSGCNGGGEAYRLAAAKLTLMEYIRLIRFVATCKNGKHKLEREYSGCTATQQSGSADVSVVNNRVLKAMVQVKADTNDSRQSVQSRAMRVGAANVWDVGAMDVLKLQTDLHRASAVIKLVASNARECEPCTEAATRRDAVYAKRKRAAEAAERKRQAAEAERARNKRATEAAKATEAAEAAKATIAVQAATIEERNPESKPAVVSPRAVVEIIDDETIRRNGVVMKKKHLPSVCSKACYTWVEAQEEC